MAKMKNLFIGCPVQVKGSSEAICIITGLDDSDHTAWITYPAQCYRADGWQDIDRADGWRRVEDLKLATFPDPHKVVAHLERFA